MSTYRALATAMTIALGAATLSAAPAAKSPAEVKIGSASVHADGCHSTSQTFSASIPNADHLDTAYKGALGGIKVVETSGNGPDHGYTNFMFVASGTAVTYALHAQGSGKWVDPPCVPGIGCIGGGVCVGAAGGWEGIDVYAEYRPATHATILNK